MPIIRQHLEDFEVEEIPTYDPDGSGPFLWLWVEKRERNTHEVAEALARGLALTPRDVGWAGRKDRRAITRQAFTVPATAKGGAVEPRLSRWAADAGAEGIDVLRVDRCRQRLRTGDLDGNRFRLVVRDVDATVAASAVERVAPLVQRGLPNRFGNQRYGRSGRNVERGLEILRRRQFKGDRRRAMFMMSALQSRVFDAVLDQRPHDQLWSGDLAVIHRSGDWISIDDPADEAGRLDRFELSPTGPIFGTKVKHPTADVEALESQVLHDFLAAANIDDWAPPRGLRLTGDRRPLRVRPGGLRCTDDRENQAVHLAFSLPAGSYATVLVEALVGPVDDA